MQQMDRDKLVSEEKVRVGPALQAVGGILRKHVWSLLAWGLALVVPLELIGAALTSGNPDVPRSGAPVGADVISGLVKLEPIVGDVLVLLVAVPLIVGAVSLLTAAELAERPIDVSGAFAGARRRISSLGLVTLVLIVGTGVVGLVAGLLDAAIPTVLPSGSIGSVIAVIVIMAGFAVLLPFALIAYPIAMLQGTTATDRLRSAVDMAREGFVMLLGRAIAVLAVASLLATGARFVVMLVVGIVSSGPFASAIGEAVGDAIFLPMFAAGATVVYVDQRGRRGGFDDTTLVEAVDAASPGVEARTR